MKFRPEFSWEFLSADEIAHKSLRALRNHIKHIKEVSPYYRDLFSNISHEDINTLDDFHQLPLTNKTTLSENTAQFISVNSSQIVETVITSGSTGIPLVLPLTSNDLERIAFNEALSFHSTGISDSDTAHIMVNLDRLYIAGMAYYRGLVLLGTNTMRTGVLPVEIQKYYLETLPPSVIVALPSHLRKLSQELAKLGFDSSKSSVNKVICIGESLKTPDMKPNATAKALQEFWGANLFSTYSSTELAVSFCECTQSHGGHAHPELVYTEIVDEHGKPVPDGTPGELVATPLGVEGVPLVRYQTGDITYKIPGTCSCGRNSMRIGPILGRKAQLIKIQGTTIYPLTLTDALDELDMIQDYLIILENDSSLSDRVVIHVVSPPSSVEKIANHLRAVTKKNFPILVSNMATLQSLRGSNRKRARILDWRKYSHTEQHKTQV